MVSSEEYTNYEENPVDIKDVTTIRIKPGKKRREIKDLAADLVYGVVPTGEGSGLEDISSLSIASYPKYNNREHRILHRAYNRYKAKKEQQELELAPLSVVNTWDKDKQTKWFTAQMNRGARNVLPALASVAALPWAIQGAVVAPVATALSIGGGLAGSKIGGYYGRKIDTRRHNLSRAEVTGSLVGGLAGGAIGGISGSLGDVVLHAKFPNLPPVRNTRLHGDFSNHLSPYSGKVRLIRNLGVVPEVDINGNVIISPEDDLFTNWTTDLAFRTHRSYKTRPGEHLLILDPNKIKGTRLISAEPGDTFMLNTLKLKPEDLTFVSGDDAALALAKSRGFNTQVNTFAKNARAQFAAIPPNRFSKGFRGDPSLTKALDDYVEAYVGRPTYADYTEFGKMFNIEVPVVRNNWFNRKYFPYRDNARLPNFKHVLYKAAPSIESDFVNTPALQNMFEKYNLSLKNHPKFDPPKIEIARDLINNYLDGNIVPMQ